MPRAFHANPSICEMQMYFSSRQFLWWSIHHERRKRRHMDSGAHFHKCDFQVHTPRDASWVGQGATTAEERQEFAEQLVVACRAKGIQAVAITDHHDIVFIEYIRRAAMNETDASGKPIPAGGRADLRG